MRRILVSEKNEFKCSSESKSLNLAVKKLGDLYKNIEKNQQSSSEIEVSTKTKKKDPK